jgi:hypothetical protein
MANPERGEQTLVADGQSYTLRLTTNACAELEDFVPGMTWDKLQVGIRNGSMKSARLLLWTALRDHHPDVATTNPESLKAIGTMVDRSGGINGRGLAALLAELKRFVALNEEPFQDDEDEPGGAKGAQQDPTAPEDADLAGVGSSSTRGSSG